MANCSQINNTTIKGTSAVTYDSTPLPCTDVATCDGLNDILSKFDAVICDVKASVDSITEDVINLTEDLMLITEEIVDIQNQIFICCPICEFTGTADQLPDPTTTTTSTSSSTTTTSTSSTTTTTSTTLLPAPTLENSGQTVFVGAHPNECDPEYYPYTLTSAAMPKPWGFAAAIAPSGSYSSNQIEYVEIVNVFPSTEVSIQYNGLPVAPGMQLVPINNVTWEDDMFITRTTFNCTAASQIWTVRIKLYGYDISNSAQHTITYSEIQCPNCTSSTTTTTTTEYCYCYTYEVTVTEENLNESIDGQVSVQFRNCNEDEVTVNYDVSGIYILDVFENDITQTIETISGAMLTENQPINTGFCCYTSPLFTGLRNNTGNETDTCSTLTTQIWLKEDEYGGIIRILNNSLGTIGFNGYDQFWTIQKDSSTPQNFRISNDGYIIEYGNLCV